MYGNSMLFLRFGYHREFALRTLFKKNIESILIDKPFSDEVAFADYAYFMENLRNPQELFEFAIKIYKERKCDGVFTFSDNCIVAKGMLSDYLELDYFSEKLARLLTNKLAVRKYLAQIGADNTKYFEVKSMEDLEECSKKLLYPFILKPTDRCASKGVIVIKKEDQLKENYDYVSGISKNGVLIAEEFIYGDEYCAEILVYNRDVYVLSISKKIVAHEKYCIELIDITPAPISLEHIKKIEEYLRDTISEFGIINSMLHVEVKICDGEQLKIIEINPRPAGGNLVEAIYDLKGLNVYDYAYDIALKRKIDINNLKTQIERPFNGYALFYSFINPAISGTIKSVQGVDRISSELKNGRERVMLFYDKGDFLPRPETNEDARGYIYIQDSDYDEIVKRAYKIENLLEYKLE